MNEYEYWDRQYGTVGLPTVLTVIVADPVSR